MKKAIRPAIFKWRQTAPELILCAVRWYLRYSLSLRDVEELLDERGLKADHTTVWRWVQRYGPELEQRLNVLPSGTLSWGRNAYRADARPASNSGCPLYFPPTIRPRLTDTPAIMSFDPSSSWGKRNLWNVESS